MYSYRLLVKKLGKFIQYSTCTYRCSVYMDGLYTVQLILN